MSVNPTNLIMGPADMYLGMFAGSNAVVEPEDTDVNTAPAASANWTDVGGTSGGVQLVINMAYTALDCDQLVDVPERRISSRDVTITTSMAEGTLENLTALMNDSVTSSGAGYKTLEPSLGNSATQPSYRAALFDGFAPNSLRRRVIVRKVLNTNDISTSFEKAAQSLLSVQLNAHYISSTVAPFKITDQVPA